METLKLGLADSTGLGSRALHGAVVLSAALVNSTVGAVVIGGVALAAALLAAAWLLGIMFERIWLSCEAAGFEGELEPAGWFMSEQLRSGRRTDHGRAQIRQVAASPKTRTPRVEQKRVA